jgi:hypothetical protein
LLKLGVWRQLASDRRPGLVEHRAAPDQGIRRTHSRRSFSAKVARHASTASRLSTTLSSLLTTSFLKIAETVLVEFVLPSLLRFGPPNKPMHCVPQQSARY